MRKTVSSGGGSSKTSASQEAHLRFAARVAKQYQIQTTAVEAIEEPEYPETLWYLWEYFEELNLGRPAGFSGIASLTWEGVESWSRLMRRTLEPQEVHAIFLVDASYRAEMMDDEGENEDGADAPKKRPKSGEI